MICISRVHAGVVASLDGVSRSRQVEVGVLAAMALASASVKFSTPWSVLKWYFTQNFSPPAFTHMKVWLP